MTRNEFINKLSDWEDGKIGMEDLLTAAEQCFGASNGAKPIVSGTLPPVSEIETAALLHEEQNSNNFKMSASDDFKAGVEWLKLKMFSGGNNR